MRRIGMSNASKLLLLFGGNAPAFDQNLPATITGLALWLDADDASTLFQANDGTTPAASDGDVVGYWGDKSGAGRHAVQATTANKPLLQLAELNGRSVVQFNATDHLISTFGATLTQPNTMFLVARHSASSSYFTDGIGGFARHVIQANSGFYKLYAGTGFGGNAAEALNTWKQFTGVVNGASSALRINGTQTDTGDAGAHPSTGFTLASVQTLANTIPQTQAEVLLYNALLTAPQIAAVESYLNAKWAVY